MGRSTAENEGNEKTLVYVSFEYEASRVLFLVKAFILQSIYLNA